MVRQTRSVAKRQQAAASISTQASAPETPHRQAVNKRRKSVGEGTYGDALLAGIGPNDFLAQVHRRPLEPQAQDSNMRAPTSAGSKMVL